LFAGPVGAAIGAAAGAATGGATAKLADYGVSEKEIKYTADNLESGSSAIILYIELKWADRAVKKLEENVSVAGEIDIVLTANNIAQTLNR